MSGDLRVLDTDDLPQLLALLRRDRVTNLFLASRVTTFGLAPDRLGCNVYGYLRGGELVAACHLGANVVPVAADTAALDLFVEAIGERAGAVSIMGPSGMVADLYLKLAQRWPSWRNPREIRAHQPLMVIDHDPQVGCDPRIQRLDEQHLDPYLRASVAMYTEEVGVSPMTGNNSYKRYVRTLMQLGRAMGGLGVKGGRGTSVWFKSDIGSAWEGCCQVQGVWLDPELRGRGLAAPAMAQVVKLCRERHPVVSLYVNDYNIRARRLYETVGFRTVGEFASVLY